MKSTEVNALVSTLRSDATPQIAGFLYQFVVALDYCFQLMPGQSLYIEKYGDVAIKGDGSFDGEAKDTSVEVKMYADNLDVKHHNLLNTLNNWLEDDFNFETYQTLVIYTTQSFSKKSTLIGWERKSPAQRLKCVWDAYSKYLKDNHSKIEDKDPSKHTTIKENARQMKRVLGSVVDDDGKVNEIESKQRLQELLSRVCIIDSCQNLTNAYNGLMKYTKMATTLLRESFINSLLGFIISPKNMKDGWKIEEEAFAKQVQTLAKEMAPQSIAFPDAPDVTVSEGEYDDAPFVLKLKQIDYNRIPDAAMDFAKTTGLLAKEFDRPSAEKNLANYQNELLQIYQLRYDNAVDELAMKEETDLDMVKNASRIFLRNVLMAARVPEFEPFGMTKIYFSNGMCHYLANDSLLNVKWILKDD